MNISKYSLSSSIAIIFSPLLSLVLLVHNIYKKNLMSFYLLSFVIGTFSFLYVPYITDDKTRHIDRIGEISELNGLEGLIQYITSNNLPDFISYVLMYFMSQISSNPGLFFFITATVTYFLFSHVFFQILRKFDLKSFEFIFILLFIVSFDYVFLFSGVRFYLAAGLIIYGWYLLFFTKRWYYSFVLFSLAIFTHFASSIIILPVFILYYFPRLNYKLIFLCSLIFLLIPSELVYQAITMLPLSASYIDKAHDYLMFTDIQLSAAADASTFRLLLYFKNSWFYVISLYLIFNKNRRTILQNTLFSLLALRCVFGNMPTITYYYDTIILFFIVLFLIESFAINNSRGLLFVFLMYCFLNFCLEIYKCRESFIVSNIDIKNIYSISLFSSERPDFIQTIK